MITMSIDEIDARDMRKIAIHECGHAYVARHFGMWAQPDIWRNETANPCEEMMWCGNTRYHSVNRTPLRHRRIAIAGAVAELMDDPDFEVECLEEVFTESFECNEWSLTDREGAIGWTLTDLRSVHSILRRNWKAIEEEVEFLISKWS